ncbi:hypothetical protein PIB30_051195 [Stylosanthes scabra]|uniref:Uncharacterized protein n=1 Tax=Stylosanthes scabra TaxID=79078 RepID=A0ABU6XJG0_9FABA|nr:hypothetical protein [Stylosanthes scabra]
MLEEIRVYLMIRCSHNRENIRAYHGTILPRIRRKLETRAALARRWQMSGIPCPHVISCAHFKGMDLEDAFYFVSDLRNYTLSRSASILKERQRQGTCFQQPTQTANKRRKKFIMTSTCPYQQFCCWKKKKCNISAQPNYTKMTSGTLKKPIPTTFSAKPNTAPTQAKQPTKATSSQPNPVAHVVPKQVVITTSFQPTSTASGSERNKLGSTSSS